jgi:hypothetical protein
MDLVIFYSCLKKAVFFTFFTEMSLNPEEVERLAVDNLNRTRLDPQAANTMSRRRFFLVQMNSLIVGVLTCIAICIFTLSRVENLPEFFFGPCGIIKLLKQNFTHPYTTESNETISDIDKCFKKTS